MYEGVSYNDSETKTLPFPKWEKEGKLKKIEFLKK